MSKGSALGQSLKHITNLKLREVERQRAICSAHVEKALAQAASQPDVRDRVASLLESIDTWKGMNTLVSANTSVSDISSFLLQSRYDSSISTETIAGWASSLEKGMRHAVRRHDFAKLFADLLNEWLASGDSLATIAEDIDDAGSEAGTETWQTRMPRQEKQQQMEQIQNLIFSDAPVDVPAIESHFKALFAGKEGETALAQFRHRLSVFGSNMENFRLDDSDETKSLIRSLLGRDLLSAEKTATVRSFLDNKIVLEEITSVLNLQLTSIDTWDWPEEGVDVEMRRHLSGKYRAYLDNEIVQALLFQRIGIIWSIQFKLEMQRIVASPAFNHETPLLSVRLLVRRQKFLQYKNNVQVLVAGSIEQRRQHIQRNQFFLTQLPTSAEDESDYSDDVPKVDESKFSQQSLLRLAGTEVLLNQELFGSCTVLRSDLEWFGPSLPHDTILTVLRFYGLPDAWLSFFRKWLKSKICFDRAEGVKERQRGVPIAHSLSVFFGEAVLSGLDFSINQVAGGIYLYRIYDDFWLFSPSAENCASAWNEMKRYTELVGIKLNMKKTGSACAGAVLDPRLPIGNVEWGFLVFDASTSRFKINTTIVETHIKELKLQLAASTSLFGFVNVLNKYLSFFRRNFAEPARCLGTAHLDEAAATFSHIIESVLPPESQGSIVRHVKSIVSARFGIDVPAAWCFLDPNEGGLGVSNPVLDLLPLRKSFANVQTFFSCFTEDKLEYDAAKKQWESAEGESALDGFVYREEYDAGRQTQSVSWGRRWDELQNVGSAAYPSGFFRGARTNSQAWVIALYKEELLDYFGALEVADSEMIPTGLLQAFRSSKVAWDQ